MSILKNNKVIAVGDVNTYHPPILSCMWSDHIINDIQWLRADTFSWQSGYVYKTVYDKLLEEFNNTVTEETLYVLVNSNTNSTYFTKKEPSLLGAGDCVYNSDGSILDTVSGKIIDLGPEWEGGYEPITVYGNNNTYLGTSTGEIIKNNIPIENKESGITFRYTYSGYKIADSSQEDAILNKYNSDGISWYYILDTANHRFKLPRTKFGFEGLRSNVGNDIAESLPNITGTYSPSGYRLANTGTGITGAFYCTTSSGDRSPYNVSGDAKSLNFDASRSSSTYQDNAPVQERATQMYLYFYVGEYAQTAIEQTAGLNAELFNGKLDLNASGLSTQGKSYVSGLGMPSSRYINLTLGVSGTQYTAPANGWFTITKKSGAENTFLYMNGSACEIRTYCRYSGDLHHAYVPCVKGKNVIITYSGNGAVERFRFVYAEGEI